MRISDQSDSSGKNVPNCLLNSSTNSHHKKILSRQNTGRNNVPHICFSMRQVHSLTVQIEQMEPEMASLREEIKRKESEIETLKSKISDLDRDLRQSRENESNVENKLRESESQKQKVTNMFEDLKRKYQDLDQNNKRYSFIFRTGLNLPST